MICRRLRLSSEVRDVMKNGNPANDYLASVLSGEVKHRDDTRTMRYIKSARFPEPKSFNGFIFDNVIFPDSVSRDYFTDGVFLSDRRGVFLYGPPGTGKTHFAIATGIYACERGIKTRFWRAYDLCEMLKLAASRNELGKFQSSFKSLGCLIIDEFGFYPSDTGSIGLLFELFCSSIYQKVGCIFTSNLSYDEWIMRSQEKKMADALIDRINGMSHIIGFGGESHRYEVSAMTG